VHVINGSLSKGVIIIPTLMTILVYQCSFDPDTIDHIELHTLAIVVRKYAISSWVSIGLKVSLVKWFMPLPCNS